MSQIFSRQHLDELAVALRSKYLRRRCARYLDNDDDDESNAQQTDENATSDSHKRLDERNISTNGSHESGAKSITKTDASVSKPDEVLPKPKDANLVSSSPSTNSKDNLHRAENSNDLIRTNKSNLDEWRINTKTSGENSKFRANFANICSICLSDSPIYHTAKGSFMECLFFSRLVKQKPNPIITPCLCANIRSRQHKRCIEDWIEQTGTTSCPFCLVKYDVSRTRRGLWCYIRYFRLERDFILGILMIALSLYQFIVGLLMISHYLHVPGFAPIVEYNDDAIYETKLSRALNKVKLLFAIDDFDVNWFVQNEITSSRSPSRNVTQQYTQIQPGQTQAAHLNQGSQASSQNDGWLLSTQSFFLHLLFIFVCLVTKLILVGVCSLTLVTITRHSTRYWLWSRQHSNVDVKPYNLLGQPSVLPLNDSPSGKDDSKTQQAKETFKQNGSSKKLN